ncbi:hypothetical protein [Streptomyces sp. VB1]|uniref:hypothetical protein n=1 Tax=Streptomyces sp. VB1 TaxID=2986803 RepID=UPI002242698B|nr:hypothetical protein [Streptomyces sp. VB1]UZI30243.1 hypothetical protein OH133_20120 [Streptomyces sp. VB1]
MSEKNGAAEGGAVDPSRPLGPFLREYTPTGAFRQGGARTTSVLFYRRGYSVAGVSGIEHYDKPPLARPHTICEIATGTFVTTLRMELPASGGATFFKAEVDIHWTVEDPHLVAVRVVTDIAERLTAPTLERLWEISARHPVHQAEQARTAITAACVSGQWNDLGTDLGLRVRLFVRLRVDDRTISHEDAVRSERSDEQLAGMRQLKYLRMLRGGELEQLSHMLAANPKEANNFLEKIRQEGRQDEKERVDRVLSMIADGRIHSDAIETRVLDDLSRQHLGIQGAIGTQPVRRAHGELTPAPEEPFTPGWVEDEPPVRQPRPPVRDAEPEPPAPRDRNRNRDDGWGWVEGDG